MKKILIACEESQEVCKAFRELGFEAYSCDIQDCSGGHPEWHIKGDVLEQLNKKWDLIIAHPPCTYLTKAGCRWLYPKGELNQERYKKGLEAKEFFMKFYNADCKYIVIENPVPQKIYDMPKPTQIIQPYQFGHKIQKATCLWIKGLPRLRATKIMKPEYYYDRKGIRHTKLIGWNAKKSSKTFRGIAIAIAEQWGEILSHE